MKYNSLFFSHFLLCALAFSTHATTVLPMGLAQLSQQAETIFHGKVTANRVEKDTQSGQVVTYTDFDIIDPIKGNTGKQHTIKQLGGQLAGSAYVVHVHGIPRFTVGEEYVVFLPEASALGFCSPLGLHQGSFSIREIDGVKVISNGRRPEDAGIFQPAQARAVVNMPLATDPEKPSQSNLTDFIYTIRTLTTD